MSLLARTQYSLVDNSTEMANLEYYHVKLTDSAIKAIERMCQSKSQIGNKSLSLSASGNSGALIVPQEDGTKQFHFNVSSIAQDDNSSYECVKLNGRSQALSSLGRLTEKVTVQGNDESFSLAQERIIQAEDEQKKSCTKVLKPAGTGTGAGRSIGVRRTVNDVQRHPKPVATPAGSQSGKPPVKVIPTRPTLPAKPAITTPPKPQAPVPPPISRQSLRDRVIHLVAVHRFQQRADLLAHLLREGSLTDSQKAQLDAVLAVVTHIDPRTRAYTLSSVAGRELREDWMGYTSEEERAKVREVIRAANAAAAPQSSQPRVLPRLSVPQQQHPLPGQGRASPPVGVPKRQSEPSKKSSPPYSLSCDSSSATTATASSAPRTQPPQTQPKSTLSQPVKRPNASECRDSVTNNNFPADNSSRSKRPRISTVDDSNGPETGNRLTPPSPRTSLCVSAPHSPVSNLDFGQRYPSAGRQQQLVPSTPAGATLLLSDAQQMHEAELVEKFTKKYPALRTPTQRQLYQAEFDKLYPTYHSMFTKLSSKSEQLDKLDAMLKSTNQSAPAYQSLCSAVFGLCSEIRSAQHQELASQTHQLHLKLARIKECVLEFDALAKRSAKSNTTTPPTAMAAAV